MKTKIYSKGCDWCGATGYVDKFYQRPGTTEFTKTCPVCVGSGKIEVTEREDGIWTDLKGFFIKEGFTIKHDFKDNLHNVVFYYDDEEVILCQSFDIYDAYADAILVCLKYYGENLSKEIKTAK